MSKELLQLLKTLRFNSIKEFKRYMLNNANLNEYGAICYTEKKNGFILNYSNNCKHKFGIGGNIKGIFEDYRFN